MGKNFFSVFFKRHPLKEIIPWVMLAVCVIIVCIISPLSISEIVYENEPGDCRTQTSTVYYEAEKAYQAFTLFSNICSETKETFDIAITVMGYSYEDYSRFNQEMEKLHKKNVKIRIYTNVENASFFPYGEVIKFNHPGYEMRMNFFISDMKTIAFFDSFSFNTSHSHYKYTSVIRKCKGAVNDIMAIYEMLLLNVDDYSKKVVKSKWVSGIGFDKSHISDMMFFAGPTKMFPTGRPKVADLMKKLVDDQKDKVVLTHSIFRKNLSSFKAAYNSALTAGLFESIPFNENGMHLLVTEEHFNEFPTEFHALADIMVTTFKMAMECKMNIEGTLFFTVYRFLLLPMGLDEIFDNKIVYVGFYAAENIMSPFYVFWRNSKNVCNNLS